MKDGILHIRYGLRNLITRIAMFRGVIVSIGNLYWRCKIFEKNKPWHHGKVSPLWLGSCEGKTAYNNPP